jgi:endonuclease/exonuclease/phosphatase (EEP) superfamily protein YafD
MERFFFVLTFFFLVNTSANATIRPFPAVLFKLIPVHQAHAIMGSAREPALNPGEIKAFVWNIKKTEEKTWRSEFIRFGQQQDLFLLQEVAKTPTFEEVAATFEDVRWDMGISFLLRYWKDAPTGTMIGAKAIPSDVLIKHTIDLEPFVETPKAMTFAKYPIYGMRDELLVISVHGINITSFAAFERHMVQAKQEILKHEGPVLFAGDFNTRTKQRTRYLMGLVKELGLENVDFENGHQRMVWKFTKNYLDHSFVRGLKITKAKVVGGVKGSDHKPMFLEMAID